MSQESDKSLSRLIQVVLKSDEGFLGSSKDQKENVSESPDEGRGRRKLDLCSDTANSPGLFVQSSPSEKAFKEDELSFCGLLVVERLKRTSGFF
jgi:hypothetical protein